MVSTEPDSTLRRVVGWLPAAILGIITLAASIVVLRSEGPATRDPRADERGQVAVLSVRRTLDPLLRRAADSRLVARLDEFVATQPGDTCLVVRAGDLDYGHRADDPQTPASLQKLLTATAALLELGEEATYETTVLGFAGDGGVVPGDVILQGGGDPILATAPYSARERNQPQIFSDFERLADAVVSAGITVIQGGVVGDDARYDGERYDPVWPSRFLAQGQIGPVTALSVNDGFAFFPDQTGVFGAAPDPAAYAAQVLTDALRARGVVVDGDPRSGPAPPDVPVLARHESPPLSQVVRQMLQESDNNTAELVLKELGRRIQQSGSFAGGEVAVAEVLAATGLVDGATIADGSGLAAENQVTCDGIVDVLDHAPTAETIEASLAVAGESGTLARRWLGTELVGRVRAKTGTLNQVSGLAGHVTSADDRDDVRFALIVNLPPSEFVDGEVIDGQQRLAEILTAHPDVPDVSGLRPSSDRGT